MFAAAFTACTLGLSLVLPPVLSTAQEVRGLPAGAARLVKLCGVVTFAPRSHRYFYLQDESGGVRVECARCDRPLASGDTVEVTGITGPGAFLPKVHAARVRAAPGARSKAPAPLRFNLTTDEAHYLDGQWVSVEAVLQSAWTSPDRKWLKVDLGRGRGNVVAYIPRSSAPDVGKVQSLRGAVVRLRGVWEWGPGGSSPPHLLVASAAELVVARAAEKADALPLLTARALAQFRHDPVAARLPVRVSGVVTLNYSSRQLFLHDDTGVVQVAYRNRVAPRPGQRVAVVGFPRIGTDPVRLDNAQVCVTDGAVGALPAPHPGTVGDAASGRLDGRVVAFTGRVLGTGTQGDHATANVLVDGVTFTALFLTPEPRVAVGSTIEVTGVATRQQYDKFRPHTFAVVVAGDNYRVLEAPPPAPAPVWWTPGRIAAGVLGACLLGGAGTALMRRQVRRAARDALREQVARRKLEEQLKLAARLEAAGRLAGGVAHDFNNMLTVINGCAALLEAEIGEGAHPDRALKFAGAIRRAGEQAATLTRQMLAFSRQQAVAPYPLDLNDVLAGGADMLERLLGDRIAVRLQPGPGVPLAVAEPGLLLQVLLNLAVNAADAMPQGGTFALATSAPDPGWVRLTAADTGTGMTAEVKARAFEPGFTTKAPGKGTGLGLSTVSGIVRGLGGRIGLVSEPGRGTAFEIDLPAAPPAGPTAAGATTVAPARPTVEVALDATLPEVALAPAVVLLVEDEEAVCALLHHVLEAAGYAVLAACDPDAALALLGRHPGALDLLVTDVMLPGQSGRQLADCVRALHPTVKVLFMSGYNVEEIREQGVSEEQVEFLHKPFLPRELVARVAQLIVPSHP